MSMAPRSRLRGWGWGPVLPVLVAAVVLSGAGPPSQTGLRIAEIQGRAHLSPLAGQDVAGVGGVVTAVRANGFYLQDPAGDGDAATSDAVFVFTRTAPSVALGDGVTVAGTVQEFRPSDDPASLSVTEIVLST